MDDDQQDVQEVQETPEAEAEKQETDYSDREKQLYARAKKAEEELKQLRDTPPEPPKQTPKEDITKPKPEGLSIDDKVDLRLEGYSKEDIEVIERNMAGRTLEETKGDPYVKAALDGVRATRTAEDATPEPSTTVPTFTSENKTWAQMSPAERKANYQDALSRLQGRGGNSRVE